MTNLVRQEIKLGMIVGLFVVFFILLICGLYKVITLRIAHLRRMEEATQDEEAFRNEELVNVVPFSQSPAKTSENTAETAKEDTVCESFAADALWKEYRFSDRRKDEEQKSRVLFNRNQHAVVTLSFYYQSYNKIFRVHVQSAEIYSDTDTSDDKDMDTRVKLLLVTALKRQIVYRTKIVKLSNNPEYDQIFMFPPLRLKRSLIGATLEVSLWNVNEFYEEDILGITTLKLKDYDLTRRTILDAVVTLEEEKKDPGFLFVGLSYNPKEEKLTVILIKAFKLKYGQHQENAPQNVLNPYAEVYLLCNGKRIKEKHTNVIWETSKPVFNELVEFIVPADQLDATDVMIFVMHLGRITATKENIGQLTLGANSSGYCLEQWNKALESHEKPIAQWHKLQA